MSRYFFLECRAFKRLYVDSHGRVVLNHKLCVLFFALLALQSLVSRILLSIKTDVVSPKEEQERFFYQMRRLI